MKLYIWNNLIINGSRYSIFALAEDIESAKVIAIKSSSGVTQNFVKDVISKSDPIIYNETASFIKGESPQLI